MVTVGVGMVAVGKVDQVPAGVVTVTVSARAVDRICRGRTGGHDPDASPVDAGSPGAGEDGRTSGPPRSWSTRCRRTVLT